MTTVVHGRILADEPLGRLVRRLDYQAGRLAGGRVATLHLVAESGGFVRWRGEVHGPARVIYVTEWSDLPEDAARLLDVWCSREREG
ncbi:MAG: hypothetical protein Q8Q14_06380 [Gemmatimonadales bacterium]|nr:hypothetical protein [Gemmatimonadales bacterium]